MSFIVDGITFYEPGDFSLVALASVDGVLSYSGDFIRRVAKADLANHMHNRIDDGGTNFVTTVSQVQLQSTLSMFLKALAGPVFIESQYGGYSIYLKAPTGSHIACWPPGNNITFWASTFSEFSSASLKTSIEDIPNAVEKVKEMKGEVYDLGNKTKAGLVVEHNPSEIVTSAVDGDGVETKGIDISSVLSYLVEAVKSLETRIQTLEKGGI